MAATQAETPLIEARGLRKRYGSIVATDGVDFDIMRGEIVAIVGDNGAGKSTLIKMISGAVTPDEGEIRIDGVPVSIRSPIEARAHGVETVFQDLAMPPNLDVVTNIYLGREPMRRGPLRLFGAVDKKAMRKEAAAHLSDLSINIPRLYGSPVSALSGGQRQSVAIARAMVWASKLVIMDEPTAALGVAQSAKVLEIVRQVRDRGISVAIISHILPHVLDIADRVIVLRHGRKVAELPTSELDEHKLIELIVGVRSAQPAASRAAVS
ncbi:ATP-binding cassette domain-containing protein [Conexibacter arvalis]|uniref:ABC-type sugar transport system ATPase subunit n=1 Tax=Conexibacter arvalis TaxID=912552 RepID=A0A840I840_9ACTN|nr:ATP-binding cassette domain-containing protein [Conexibacter arvalis]MBB4660495.1 ABC-type sugar transport system ATPase subunit [Conexibacter arvalis]